MSTITIIRGSTYRDTLRWASSECVFVSATLVPGAPVRFTATAHGIPDGWMVNVEGHRSIDEGKRYPVRAVDANTLEIPCMNGAAFKAGAVVIRYNKPVELDGYSARMQIKDKISGTVLLELTSAAGEGIEIDDDAKTISREIPADVTADLTWKRGVFDLEMVQGDYVIKIDSGIVTVQDEVTT